MIDPLKLSLQTQMLLYEVRESSTFLRSVGISKNQPNLESKHPNMSLLLLKCLYKPNFQFLSSVQQQKLYFRHRISKFYHHRISCYFEIPQQDDESCFAKKSHRLEPIYFVHKHYPKNSSFPHYYNINISFLIPIHVNFISHISLLFFWPKTKQWVKFRNFIIFFSIQ